MMKPAVVLTSNNETGAAIRNALDGAGPPLVIVAGEASGEIAPEASTLLRLNVTVAGVLDDSMEGAWAESFLACDIIFAPDAKCFLRFQPGGSWPALLALRFGRDALSRVIFSGGMLAFQEMERAGWCRRGGIKEAVQWAEGKSAEAQRLLRPLLYRQAGLAESSCLALERAAFGLAWAGHDAREGARAFLEKRKPSLLTSR